MIALLIVLVSYVVHSIVRRSLATIRLPGPPGIPFIGHLQQVLQPNFHRILSAWSERYGGIYSISILGLQGVVVSDPEAIAQVLGRDGSENEVPKHLASYAQLNLLWGGVHQHSIFTGLSTNTWRLVRRAVSPCFSTANIRHAFLFLAMLLHAVYRHYPSHLPNACFRANLAQS